MKKALFVDASQGPEYVAAICHNSLSSEVRNHHQDSSETITKLSRLDTVIYVNLKKRLDNSNGVWETNCAECW